MGFTQGAKITSDILDEIANGLITTKLWHNVDTTWNTLVKAPLITANNNRRVLAYGPAGAAGKGNTTLSADITVVTNIISVTSTTNFSVGDKIVIGPDGTGSEVRVVSAVGATTLTLDANVNMTHFTGERCANVDLEIYVALEVINTSTQVHYDGNTSTQSKGIRITLSASWDSNLHIYPSLNQQSFIQFETWNFNVWRNNTGVQADLAVLQVIYYLWIESNGFVIMAKPEPTAVDGTQQSFFLCLERNPNKEYADGYSNFFAVMQQNIFHQGRAAYPGAMFKGVLRPFAYQYPTSGENYDSITINGAGVNYWLSPSYYTYKSQGNGKVYYVKPIIHNHAGQMMPITQSELFFPFSEAVGLIDGDVIAIEGSTTKYLCKSLDSPDSTARLNFAMKYVA